LGNLPASCGPIPGLCAGGWVCLASQREPATGSTGVISDRSENLSARFAERLQGATALVSGGCGFIGSHLVRRLADLGAARIVVVDDLRSGEQSTIESAGDGVDLRVLSLEGDRGALRDAIQGVDYVFHMAAVKGNDPDRDAEEMLQTNVFGTYQLLEAAAQAEVKRLVFASSLYAYGRVHEPPMQEEEPALPNTIYGSTKLGGERFAAAVARRYGLSTNSLRYFFVYGPGLSARNPYRSVINLTFERLLRDEPAAIHGDGKQVLDYVYIDDAIDATLLAATEPADGQVLNVCSGEGIRVKDLIAALLRAARREDHPVREAPPDATHGTSRVGNPDKAAEVLGFRTATKIDEGLAATFGAAERLVA
jgi:UDP-glucose 4-epimerase